VSNGVPPCATINRDHGQTGRDRAASIEADGAERIGQYPMSADPPCMIRLGGIAGNRASSCDARSVAITDRGQPIEAPANPGGSDVAL
jgi:hypothetical protein